MKRGLSFIKNIGMALAMGLSVAIMAVLFNLLIDIGVAFTSGLVDERSYFLFPLAGGVLVFLIYSIYLKKDHTGIGIVQVLVELEKIKTHMMKPVRVAVQVVGAVVTLVFGFSAGRFGPIVHLGAAAGSNAGYYLKMNQKDIRLLIGCGSAAAISAVFGMPLFASVFVLEVLYKEQFADYFAPVVISSVSAYSVGILTKLTVAKPDFTNAISMEWGDVPLLIAIGLAMGLAGMFYIVAIDGFTHFFGKMKRIASRLAAGAVLVALAGFLLPLNFELHQETTIRTLTGGMGVGLLLAVGFVKLLATAITLGSGYIGGNFYPAVTIGAALGMAAGKMMNNGEAQPHFGILGMGAFLAGCLNAPISGIVWIVEYSGQFGLIVPALVVCAVSVMTTYHLLGRDIFTKSYEKTLNATDPIFANHRHK